MVTKDILLFEIEGLNTYNLDIRLNLLFYFNKFASFFYFLVYDLTAGLMWTLNDR